MFNEIYTSGLSEKFFKEYVKYMKNISDQSAQKCKEIIEQLQIPKIDDYGNDLKDTKNKKE